MNRGRHRKKKIIQKLTYEDLIKYINQMTNAQYWSNPYFLINEQRKT